MMNEDKLTSAGAPGARRWWLVALVVFGGAIFVLLGYYQYLSIPLYTTGEAEGTIAELNMQRFPPGIKVPDFSLENLQGKKVRLKQFRGGYLLLSFRTTW